MSGVQLPVTSFRLPGFCFEFNNWWPRNGLPIAIGTVPGNWQPGFNPLHNPQLNCTLLSN